VVLESKYGSPKIVNDGVTIAKEVELEDPVENIGAKLVRQAAARTNDTAGDGTTTATILSAAFIAEGLKIVAAGKRQQPAGHHSCPLVDYGRQSPPQHVNECVVGLQPVLCSHWG